MLPAHLAGEPEWRERFEREARAIAALNHAHICALHDIGREQGVDFLVMEYLEGRTLADRLKRGPLPLPEALRYAGEMADALEQAHQQGVMHRDLKPSNIMLTASGAKLLDFGLAKRKARPPAGGSAPALSELLTADGALTAQGVIAGTLPYMAPEQIEGKDVDARADIWALGVVLYEMVSGRRAFEGESPASLIAAILEREPPAIASIQPLAPPLLNRVVEKCLAKDRKSRWQAAGDLCAALQWIGARPETAPPVTLRRRERLAWTLVSLLTGLVLAVLYFHVRGAPAGSPEMRVQIVTPPTRDPVSIAISPDGRRLVSVASFEGRSLLWLRPLDSVTAQPLPGTEGASFPFWSPDSRSIGFFAEGKLKRIDIAGGPAQTVANAVAGRGGTWNRDGVILFTPLGGGPIYRGDSKCTCRRSRGRAASRWCRRKEAHSHGGGGTAESCSTLRRTGS